MGSSLAQHLARLLGRIVGRRQAVCPRVPDRRVLDRRYEQRFAIVPLQAADAMYVVLPPRPERHPVVDLSVHGLAFRVESPADKAPSPGVTVDALLLVDRQELPVRLGIRNQKGSLFGCEMVDASPQWTEELSALLSPLRLGQGLREIDPRLVEPEPDGTRARWFQSGPACNLFAWSEPDGAVAKIQLFYMRHLVEWARATGLRTGKVSDPVCAHGIKSSESFRYDGSVDAEALSFARRLLSAASLPAELRDPFKEGP